MDASWLKIPCLWRMPELSARLPWGTLPVGCGDAWIYRMPTLSCSTLSARRLLGWDNFCDLANGCVREMPWLPHPHTTNRLCIAYYL